MLLVWEKLRSVLRALEYGQVRHSELTSFFVTGLSRSTRCVRNGKEPKGSKSASSVKLLDSSWRVVRFGIELASVGCMAAMRLRWRRRDRIRGDRGKFPRTWMSLSTKSMESCGYSRLLSCQSPHTVDHRINHYIIKWQGRLTPATPKFSMVGIRCPVHSRQGRSLSILLSF